MNQILKDAVYGMGTKKQIEFIADIGGMNNEEKTMLQYLHDRKSDQYIMDEMNLNRRSFDRVQESVRSKTLLAVFYCINNTMEL